jgi:thiamine biosynthesis lipoprotein
MNYTFYILIFLFFGCKKDNSEYQQLNGFALGSSFSITYESLEEGNYEKQIDSLINGINGSLSTYIPDSDISKINDGDTTVVVDGYFMEVFSKSKKVYKETNGAFDPTVGVLVNAWGFGPENEIASLDSAKIKSLLRRVGFDKVSIQQGKVVSALDSVYLDFNAIGPGYLADVIGRFLETKNVKNYLIEIGGEIRTRGVNTKGKLWKIAIEKPNFDETRSIQTLLSMNNESLATSGNYRKFKIDEITGNRYAHTMDSKTGYPSKNNLLSASVIASQDCADVDGYATAFMAMGFERSKIFLKEHPELKAFLIYDESGEMRTFQTDNLQTD